MSLELHWLGNSARAIEPHHMPYYQNQAALFQSDTAHSPDVQKKLEKQALSALHKVTDPDPEWCSKFRLIRSPLPTIPHEYYRCMEAPTHEQVRALFARLLQMEPSEVHLIRNRNFREVFAREFLEHPQVASSETLRALIDKLAGLFKEGKLPQKEVPIDFTEYLAASKRHPKEIVQEFEEIVRQKVEQIKKESPQLDLGKFSSSLTLRAFTRVHDQELLLSPLFLAQNRQTQADAQDYLVWRISSQGYRLSPHELFTCWLKVQSLSSILAQNKLPLARLTAQPSMTIRSLDEFLNHKDVAAFAQLSTVADAAPYLQVCPEAVCSLVKGFKELDIDSKFKSKNLERLSHYFYSQMLHAMQLALEHKDDIVAFVNQYELINLMIQYILDWAEPYTGKDLQEAVSKRLPLGAGFDTPLVHLKASASNGLSSILGAVEAQKGHNKLNVVVLKDCYYTVSDNVFERTASYNISILDGDKKRLTPDPEKPVDLFVCEFNHNANPKRHDYKQVDVLSHVSALVGNNLLSEQATVVIDNTIDLDQSQALANFLADPLIKSRIQAGSLNVVLLRSALKFDMLGLDNYYGGITTSINNHAAFSRFNARMSLPEDQLKGLDLQGLTHIQKHASQSIQKSIQLYMNATKNLLENIPQECFASVDSDKPIQVSAMKDQKSIFVHVTFHRDYEEAKKAFYEIAPEYADQQGERHVPRASFSFLLTSCYVDKCRFNVGAEKPLHNLWLARLITDSYRAYNSSDQVWAAAIRSLVNKSTGHVTVRDR